MGVAEEAGPTPPVRGATSVPKVSSKNLQELLHKLSVDERTRPHQFWDTQPVPKLGESFSLSLSHSLLVP